MKILPEFDVIPYVCLSIKYLIVNKQQVQFQLKLFFSLYLLIVNETTKSSASNIHWNLHLTGKSNHV